MTNSDTFAPPAEPVGHYFELDAPDPPAGTFELALVLGGTVSVGTFTAGVLDFLIEALDQWEIQKALDRQRPPAERTVPQHRVMLRVAAGTSGGGVNAVIMARALSFAYPPVRASAPLQSSPASTPSANPFYHLWVDSLGIDSLLATGELAGGAPLQSLLDGRIVERAARAAATFKAGPPPRRPYVETPWPVFLTLTNLAGIPYPQDLTGQSGRNEYFVDHADYVRLAFEISSQAAATRRSPPDAIAVGIDDAAAWTDSATMALATAAVPLGLPARLVDRPADAYRYRYYTATDEQGRSTSQWRVAGWDILLPPNASAASRIRFAAVDGACIDNEPIEIARTWLAGLQGRNPRSAADANRAVILVDPFTDVPKRPAEPTTDLLALLAPTAKALVQANRYATADLALFASEDVFSRFLITARRPDPRQPDDTRPKVLGGTLSGGDALAGGSLGGFMGFLSKAYRHHDFLLGRYNCQAFLRGWLALAPDNPVFFDPKPVRNPTGGLQPGTELPLIPLYGTAAEPQPLPAWPAGALDPQSLVAPFDARLRAVLGSVEDLPARGWIERLAFGLANHYLRSRATAKALSSLAAELERRALD